jgi:hypothetical protein
MSQRGSILGSERFTSYSVTVAALSTSTFKVPG